MCVPNYSDYAHISPHNLTLESDYSFSRFEHKFYIYQDSQIP